MRIADALAHQRKYQIFMDVISIKRNKDKDLPPLTKKEGYGKVPFNIARR